MATKTALITGCASGNGKATARAFHEDGWEVYATDKDSEGLADLEEQGCNTAELDTTSDEDAQRVVDRILDEQGRIDCLVNNAGFIQLGPAEELTMDLLEQQVDVNFFGYFRLAKAVLPAMREQESGTIVNVSSIFGRSTVPGQAAYSAAKFGLEAFFGTLRMEVANHGIDVVIVEPGPVDTNAGEVGFRQLEKVDRTGAYEWCYNLYSTHRALERSMGHIQPEQVGDTILTAANSDNPDTRYIPGPYKYPVLFGNHFVPDTARDKGFDLLRRTVLDNVSLDEILGESASARDQ